MILTTQLPRWQSGEQEALDMIRMYAKRCLLPFIGVIQIAELGDARALSMDGRYWSIQHKIPRLTNIRDGHPTTSTRSTYTRILGYNFASVGTVKNGQLELEPLHPALDAEDVQNAGRRLYETIADAPKPFLPTDHFEYWLLDPKDDSPLALLQTSWDEADLERSPPPHEWNAIPARELKVPPPEPADAGYVPPVNYRLERLMAERAGMKPRGRWFDRNSAVDVFFPPCLVREDWAQEDQKQLCDLYLQRLAPRLLMLHALPQEVRQRLERSACEQVFEIERFHPLYPEIVEDRLMKAARVEAQLRRSHTGQAGGSA
jgi:hypothetical protein